jgi:3-oxoacyl-[acyl-carrier protein] reductase
MGHALVTGASRGIGRAIALRLGRDGYRVGVHYGSDRAAAEETASRIGDAYVVHADLAEPDAAETLWAQVPGPVDVLVNNAGIGRSGDIGSVTLAEFDRVFAVNVRAPFFIVQKGLDRIVDGGRIVNISSGVTRVALPEVIAYSMTKGALDTFGRTLAKVLGERGITVNSVSPGIVDTDVNAGWLRDNPEAWARAAAHSAFNRVGEPADVADVVVFLASTDGRWVSGHDLDATGASGL